MPNSDRRSQFAAAQSGAVVPRAAVTALNTGLIKPAQAKSQNGPVQAEE
jgi:hypothetical protein